VGLRLFGSTIFNLPQKPISVRFSAKFGESEVDYQLFDQRAYTKYKSFLLRNGGNDYNLAFLRDGLAVSLIKGQMDLDYQDYQPCVVFINGEYQGIYDIRERTDNQYLANNHHLNVDNLDVLDDNMEISSGSDKDYKEIVGFIKGHNLADAKNYEYLSSKIDIDEFINYIIHKTFVGYWLFDINNKCWRENQEGGKWRWVANDMEHGFGQLSGHNYWENTIAKAINQNGELPEWSTLLFSRLLSNEEFKSEFIQRYALYLNTIYQPKRTVAITDSLKGLLTKYMPRHMNKWKTPINMAVWEGNVEFIREFLRKRPEYVRQHLGSLFAITDSANVDLKAIGEGSFLVNGVNVEASFSGQFFQNVPLTIEAMPAKGFRFSGWQGLNDKSAKISVTLMGDSTLTAVFEPSTASVIPPIIEHDTTLHASLSPWYALENIRVKPGAVLTIEAGCEILLTDKVSIYVNGGLLVDGKEGLPVRFSPDPSALARIPRHNKQARWGVIAAIDATDSISIQWANFAGSGFGLDRNKHFATISSFNSNISLKHTTISDNIQPFYSEKGHVYIGNSSFSMKNTGDLINIKNSIGAIVENCDLNGNYASDTDAIDYDGIIGGIIRNNRISGFQGSNSDGIDLGESSRDLVIEGNFIHEITDKGISVGQTSTATIRRNVIFACDMGIAVKDSLSAVWIDQNTFFANNYAVACYEKNSGKGGGAATVRNSILSGSISAPLLIDPLSTINVFYSLSDTKELPGTGNLLSDPLFVNPFAGNFELSVNSPCINAGDPFSERDPDNSRADMGAYFTRFAGAGNMVLINEINFNPAPNFDAGSWIELHNPSAGSVNIGGWEINYGKQRYVFNADMEIGAGEYLVVCDAIDRFAKLHPTVKNVVSNLGFELNKEAGQVYLMDANKRMVYTQMYNKRLPFVSIAFGKGASLELDKNSKESFFWRGSYVLGGTPGAANSTPPNYDGLYINELMASNKNGIADEQGDYDDWFEIYNHNDYPVNIGGLYFSDDLAVPSVWQAPLNEPHFTTIGSKGFLLIWADAEPNEGPLHAAFKLSADGEELGMFQNTENQFQKIDQVRFGAADGIQSLGRSPDGGSEWANMHFTPKQSNRKTMVDKRPLPSMLSVSPNPFSLSTTFNTANLPKPFSVVVIDLDGKIVWQSVKSFEEKVFMDRGFLRSGVYLYRVSAKGGVQYNGKLVVL